MTFEEMERTMLFILEQQAQLTATVDRLSVKVDRNADSATALLAIVEIQSQEIREIGESVRAVDERQRDSARILDERQREADERQRQADERGRQTDERLNALINTVERMISERKNGKSEPPLPDV